MVSVGSSPPEVDQARVNDDLIICTRHRPHDLRRCLDSVAVQTRVPTTTLVVDSSEDDDSKRVVDDFASRWPTDHTLVYVHSEPGLVHQRVVGLRESAAPIVHYVDDDTVL